MRDGERDQSRGAEAVLGAAHMTGPGRDGHQEMVRDAGALEGILISECALKL